MGRSQKDRPLFASSPPNRRRPPRRQGPRSCYSTPVTKHLDKTNHIGYMPRHRSGAKAKAGPASLLRKVHASGFCCKGFRRDRRGSARGMKCRASKPQVPGQTASATNARHRVPRPNRPRPAALPCGPGRPNHVIRAVLSRKAADAGPHASRLPVIVAASVPKAAPGRDRIAHPATRTSDTRSRPRATHGAAPIARLAGSRTA